MAIGATALVLGLVLSLGKSGEFPGFVSSGGFAALLLGLHRFGRSGAKQNVNASE